MKRVIVSGKLLDAFMNAVAKGFAYMLKDMEFKGKPEEVEIDGEPGMKWVIQVEEVEPKYLKKGIKNKKTGRMSGNVYVTIYSTPDEDNNNDEEDNEENTNQGSDMVTIRIEPDSSHFSSSLKPVTYDKLKKGDVKKFFDKWLDKHMLYVATDEEGREEILDELDVDNEDADEEFKAASTQVTLSHHAIRCAKQYQCYLDMNKKEELQNVNKILSSYCPKGNLTFCMFDSMSDEDKSSVMNILKLK